MEDIRDVNWKSHHFFLTCSDISNPHASLVHNRTDKQTMIQINKHMSWDTNKQTNEDTNKPNTFSLVTFRSCWLTLESLPKVQLQWNCQNFQVHFFPIKVYNQTPLTWLFSSISINSPSDDGQGNFYRQVYKIRVDHSTNCDFFNHGEEANIYSQTVINFTTPIIASNIKIHILEADLTFSDSAQIALNK